MKAFLSSTFWDLRRYRKAAIKAINQFGIDVEAMEMFIAKPTAPLKAVLDNLRTSDFVVLIVGFKAGSLVQRRKGLTYTLAEYKLAKTLKLPLLAFVKTSKGTWRNDEADSTRGRILDEFHSQVVRDNLPRHFASARELSEQITASLRDWEGKGRPGARRVFGITDQHFRSVTTSPLLDYEQQLRGRFQQISELNDFIADEKKSVALVKGRGGIGKSKLLRDWSRSARGWHVLWVNDAATWSAETFKEVPDGKVLIIHDDAHRSSVLDQLLVLTRDLKDRGLVKTVLSFRPTGTYRIEGALARSFDHQAFSQITQLEQLGRSDVRELATEVLGKKYRQHAALLAAVSRDTPLVTVVGGRLIARREIPPALLGNEEAFRRTVFDRFIDEQKGRVEDVGFDVRELLHLIAAINPISLRHGSFLAQATDFLHLREDQITRAGDALVRAGILLKGGTLVRVVPDVLSDFLLEQACVNEHGEKTSFADAVYEAFGSAFLPNLLRNLSELDWRIAQGHPSSSSLLKDIWDDIENRFRKADVFERRQLLDAVQACAMLQPAASIRLIKIAEEEPAKTKKGPFLDFVRGQDYVLEAIPGVLGQIAYAPEYTERAVRELWRLAKAEKKDGIAGKALVSLAAYTRYKPVIYNDRMADFVNAFVREPDAFDGAFTPLEVADKLLAREAEFTEQEGLTISFGALPLNYRVVSPVRKKVLGAVEFALMSRSVRAAVRAVESLDKIVNVYLPHMRSAYSPAEIRWQTRERRVALALLTTLVSRQEAVPVPVLRQVKHMLLQFAGRVNGPLADTARRLAEDIQSDDSEIFDAFVSAEWDFDSMNQGSYVSRAAKRQAQLDRAANLFKKQYKSANAKVGGIERLFLWAKDARIEAKSPLEFVDLLCRRDGKLSGALARKILSRKSSDLAPCMQVVLRLLRGTSRYEKIARAAAQHDDVNVARAAAATLFHLDPAQVTRGELNLLKLLSSHEDWWVRINILTGIRFLAKDANWKQRAITLAVAVRVGGHENRVADEFAEVFGPYGLGRDARPTSAEVNAVLRKLLPIDKLDGHNCEVLLTQWSKLYPDEVLSFFLKRLNRVSRPRIRRSGYAAIPHDLSLDSLSKGASYRKHLKQLIELHVKTKEEWYVSKLFWAVAAFDETTIEVVNSVLRSHKPSRVGAVIHLLQHAPPQIAFSRPRFARDLLEAAETIGPKMVSAATGRLIANAMPHVFSGSMTGEPPVFVHMRQRAESLIQEYASDHLLLPVYIGIRDMAAQQIQQMKISAADFEFENA